MKFDHIGVVVRSLELGRTHLREALGINDWTTEFLDDNIGVAVQFGRDSSLITYELVTPLRDTSPVSRALKAGVNVINHVAYLVSDLNTEARRLKDLGFIATGAAVEAVAYGNARIQFFVSDLFMLIELIEAPSHRHVFRTTPEN